MSINSRLFAKESTIPKTFLGAWSEEKGCKNYTSGGEMDPGAVITATQISRYEHECSLTSVDSSSNTSFSGKFECTQEGESSSENISLTLQPDGKLVGVANGSLPKCN